MNSLKAAHLHQRSKAACLQEAAGNLLERNLLARERDFFVVSVFHRVRGKAASSLTNVKCFLQRQVGL